MDSLILMRDILGDKRAFEAALPISEAIMGKVFGPIKTPTSFPPQNLSSKTEKSPPRNFVRRFLRLGK
jgi:hypothetical protein